MKNYKIGVQLHPMREEFAKDPAAVFRRLKPKSPWQPLNPAQMCLPPTELRISKKLKPYTTP